MINVKPLQDRILVKGISETEASISGLIINSNSNDRPEKGKVLAVGPGIKNDEGRIVPMIIKIGDQVLISKYAADQIKIEDEYYYILRESSVLAVIN